MRQVVPWAIAAAAVTVSGVTLARGSARDDGAPAGALFASLDFEGAGLRRRSARSFSMSPDGRHVAIAVQRQDGSGLGVRSLDSIGIRFLARTRDARIPFWSPDNRSIGFFADDSLKVVDVTSGLIRALCPALQTAGGSWAPDGTILFATADLGMVRTTPSGGNCTAVPLRTESRSRASSRRRYRPYFLPDGRHFIATTPQDVWIGELGTDSLVKLTDLHIAEAVILPPDYLLFHGADGMLVHGFMGGTPTTRTRPSRSGRTAGY